MNELDESDHGLPQNFPGGIKEKQENSVWTAKPQNDNKPQTFQVQSQSADQSSMAFSKQQFMPLWMMFCTPAIGQMHTESEVRSRWEDRYKVQISLTAFIRRMASSENQIEAMVCFTSKHCEHLSIVACRPVARQ
jgi:hypothetical protein